MFRKKIPLMESLIEEKPENIFDRKYKTIVRVNSRDNYLEMVDWVDLNSKGSVEVRYASSNKIDVAFENSDDAIIFKIKYSV